jgi:pyrroline-5-carboxylate reductase
MRTLAVIGVGNMGGALVRGVIARGVVDAQAVRVVDKVEALTAALAADVGVVVAAGVSEAVRGADLVLLAVKPQGMAATLAEIGPLIEDGTIVMSVAAGVTLAAIRERVPRGFLVRAMPNTPALVGFGASGFALEDGAPDDVRAAAMAVLGAVGLAVEVAESHLDAVTAVSGSGPAYVFAFVEALEAAGIAAGLQADVAARLARQTVIGAGRLLESRVEAPSVLRTNVTSPGGTTEAALKVFGERGLGEVIAAGVLRAKERGGELARLVGGAGQTTDEAKR